MASPVQLIGGAFQDSEGNVLANGYLTMKLSQDGNVAGVGNICAGIEIRITLDVDGNVVTSPAQSVWSNPDILPVNTFYRVTGYKANGQKAWGPNNQQVPGDGGTFDVGTWIPNQIISWTPPVTAVTLENNGVLNSAQTILNLTSQDASVTITDLGNGDIDLASGGGGTPTAGQGIDIASDVISGNLVMDSQGRHPQLLANWKVITGHATLVGGTVAVNLTGDAIVNIPDSYEVFLTVFTPNGTLGFLSCNTRNRTNFRINSLLSDTSLNTADTSTIAWAVVCRYDTLT